MKLRMFHRGLILVGIPLIAGIFFNSSLYFLIQESVKERLQEEKGRKVSVLGAKQLTLGTEIICLGMLQTMQPNNKKISNLFEEDLLRANQNGEAIRKFLDANPEFLPADKLKFFKQYSVLFQKYVGMFNAAKSDNSMRSAAQLSSSISDGTRHEDIGEHRFGRRRGRRRLLGPGLDDTFGHGSNGLSGFEMNLQSQLAPNLASTVEFGRKMSQTAQAQLERSNRMQSILLGLALILNPLICVSLAVFYKRSILDRIKVLASNTRALASKQEFLPALKEGDEIALLDQSFHSMQKQLKEAAENEQNLFDNASDVICVLDSNDMFLRVNPACAKHWGYEPLELKNQSLEFLIAPESMAEFAATIESAKNSSLPQTFEAKVQTKNSGIREAAWSIYWSTSEQCLFCIVHDITENKRIEAMRRQFLSMLSSDLKLPLAKIAEVISELMSDSSLSNHAIDKFKTTKRNLGRLVSLVDDLLEVTELKSGRLDLRFCKADLTKLLENAVQELEFLVKEKGLSIMHEPPEPNSCEIFIDSNRISQVLVNLLSNAIKFSPQNTKIKLSLEVQNNRAICKVEDQGRGIAVGKQARIFEKFQQAEVDDSKRKAGTGLGLPICKQIVEAHGGEIGVESEEGKGSCFWFSLPLENSAAESQQARTSRDGLSQDGLSHHYHTQSTAAQNTSAQNTAALNPSALNSLALDSSGQAAQYAHPDKSTEPSGSFENKRLPAKAGKRFPLAVQGLILVGVPALLALVLAGILTLSLLDLSHKRALELRQRDISLKSFRLMTLITMGSVLLRSPTENLGSAELLAYQQEYLETLAKLKKILKNEPSSLIALEKMKNSFSKMCQDNSLRKRTAVRGASQMAMLMNAVPVFTTMVVQTRNLMQISDRAEKLEFLNPEKELSARQKQTQLLIVGIFLNIGLSIALAMQYSLGISRRLAIMADNTQRLAAEEGLNPEIGGNDELSELDSSFHKEASILMESRKRERAVFDNSKDVLCTVSASARFISTNPAAEELWAYTKKELQELALLDLVLEDDREAIRNWLLSGFDQDAELSLECRMQRKDGKIVHCSWSATFRKEQQAMFCVVHDITAKKELEMLKDEFLSIVSHDLRTPLNSVSLTAQLVQSGALGDLSKKAKNELELIVSNCQILLELVSDILDLEKLDAGKMQLNFEPEDLSSLFAELCNRIPDFESWNFELSGELKNSSFPADRERLRQAIYYLAVFMQICADSNTKPEISAKHDLDSIEIKIKCAGVALADNLKEVIFERYKDFSLNEIILQQNPLTKNSSFANFNADLRLPLAARIIEFHGGSVILEDAGSSSNLCRISIPLRTNTGEAVSDK